MADLIFENKRNTESRNYIADYVIHHRIKRNKNALIMFVGATGSGKSYSAIRFGENLCYLQEKIFTIDRIAFTAKEFMDILNDTEKLKKGDVIILDEAGVSMSARNWQSLNNKMINYVLQTFRNLNLIVIITVPNLTFIDSQSRKLFHLLMETQNIDFIEKKVIIKPLIMQNNPKINKLYLKYPRIKLKGKGVMPIKRVRFGLPSQSLREQYELKKTRFLFNLNREIEREIERNERKDMREFKIKPLSEQEQRTMDLYLDTLAHHPNMKRILIYEIIAGKMGLARETIYGYIKNIKKKGHIV